MKTKCIAVGVPVTLGITAGHVKRINENTEPFEIDRDDIILISSPNPIYSLHIMRCGGVIIESGSRLAHICVMAIELGIPCITQASDNHLEDGQMIMMNADEGKIYEYY